MTSYNSQVHSDRNPLSTLPIDEIEVLIDIYPNPSMAVIHEWASHFHADLSDLSTWVSVRESLEVLIEVDPSPSMAAIDHWASQFGVNPSDVSTWVRLRKSKAPTADQNHDNWQQPEGPERVGGLQRRTHLNQLDEDDRDSADSLVSSDQLYSNSLAFASPSAAVLEGSRSVSGNAASVLGRPLTS